MWGYLVGILLRVSLYYLNAENFFSAQSMFTTPIVAVTRVKEAFFLMSIGKSPYDGGLCHMPPLLLWALRPLANLPNEGFFILALLSELGVAIAIQEFARKFQRSTDGSKRLSPMNFGLLFFLNPFTVCGNLAQSLQTLHILTLTLAMVAAAYSRPGLSAFMGAATLYLSPGPSWMSFFALGYLSYKSKNGKPSLPPMLYCFFFILFCTLCFLGLFTSPMLEHLTLTQVWDACYFHVFQVRDLEPGTGIFWYVFTQMFPRFHLLFCLVYHFHVMFYIFPIHVWIGNRGTVGPYASVILCVALQALFKPYQTAVDFTYLLSLILICTDFVEFCQKRFVMALCTCFFALCMLPVMNILWLIRNTGNANFFYWLQIVYFVATELMLTEWTTAAMKILERQHPGDTAAVDALNSEKETKKDK